MGDKCLTGIQAFGGQGCITCWTGAPARSLLGGSHRPAETTMLASDAVHLSRFWKFDQTDPRPHLCDSTFRCQPHPANAMLLWAMQRVVVIRGNTVGPGHCLFWEALGQDDASLSTASLVCRSSLNRARVSILCRRKVSGARQPCQADLLGSPPMCWQRHPTAGFLADEGRQPRKPGQETLQPRTRSTLLTVCEELLQRDAPRKDRKAPQVRGYLMFRGNRHGAAWWTAFSCVPGRPESSGGLGRPAVVTEAASSVSRSWRTPAALTNKGDHAAPFQN